MNNKILEYRNEFENDIKNLISCIYIEEFKVEVGTDEIINEDIYGYIEKGGNFWIAVDDDNNILGTIGAKIVDEETLEIKRMYVKKEYRGYGIAQDLLNTLEAYAVQNGFKFLVLGTYERMERAIGFYKKNLFELEDYVDEFAEERYFRKCLA